MTHGRTESKPGRCGSSLKVGLRGFLSFSVILNETPRRLLGAGTDNRICQALFSDCREFNMRQKAKLNDISLKLNATDRFCSHIILAIKATMDAHDFCF